MELPLTNCTNYHVAIVPDTLSFYHETTIECPRYEPDYSTNTVVGATDVRVRRHAINRPESSDNPIPCGMCIVSKTRGSCKWKSPKNYHHAPK